MDAITNSKVYKSLQSYWRRRSYRRLEDVATTKKAAVRLGRGRRMWKAVVVRPVKLRLRRPGFPTPGKIFSRLRNAYVDSMLLLAGGGGGMVTKKGRSGPFWDRRFPRDRRASLWAGDFEKRVLLHLYSSVIATR